MYHAIVRAVEENMEIHEEIEWRIPLSADILRKESINELLNNPKRYNIDMNKQEKMKLKLMLVKNQLPYEKTLLAISYLYGIIIKVYHNIPNPVVYNSLNIKDKRKEIYLQCISYIHYNPLRMTRKVKEDEDKIKFINKINEDEIITNYMNFNNMEQYTHEDVETAWDLPELQEQLERNNKMIKICEHEDNGTTTE